MPTLIEEAREKLKKVDGSSLAGHALIDDLADSVRALIDQLVQVQQERDKLLRLVEEVSKVGAMNRDALQAAESQLAHLRAERDELAVRLQTANDALQYGE